MATIVIIGTSFHLVIHISNNPYLDYTPFLNTSFNAFSLYIDKNSPILTLVDTNSAVNNVLNFSIFRSPLERRGDG